MSGVWLWVGGDHKRPWETGVPGFVSKMCCVCVRVGGMGTRLSEFLSLRLSLPICEMAGSGQRMSWHLLF